MLARHHRGRTALLAWLGGLVLAALLVPASARAVTARVVGGDCFGFLPADRSQPIPFRVDGLTGGQQVKVALSVRNVPVSGLPQLTAGGDGVIDATLERWNPVLGTGPTKTVSGSLIVSDLSGVLAIAPLQLTNVAGWVDATKKRATSKRTWKIAGLSLLGGDGSYWAHYFRGKRHVGVQRLGKPTNACGYLRTRAVLVPPAVRGGAELYVQASKRYRRNLTALHLGSVYRAPN